MLGVGLGTSVQPHGGRTCLVRSARPCARPTPRVLAAKCIVAEHRTKETGLGHRVAGMVSTDYVCWCESAWQSSAMTLDTTGTLSTMPVRSPQPEHQFQNVIEFPSTISPHLRL